MADPTFSLIIPCYNEAKSLPELIRRARFVAAEGGGEVILVDNGSTDDSQDVLIASIDADDEQVRHVRVDVNKGYGHGIVTGLAAARAPFAGWTHADLQTDPADVLRILPELRGRTFAKGRRYGRRAADRFFTAGMSIFESVLLLTPVRDINAQPTLFARSLMDEWGTPPDDFSIDLFAYYHARRKGFRVVRFPVIFAPRKHGVSSWNVDFRAKWRFIKRTVAYSLALRRSL